MLNANKVTVYPSPLTPLTPPLYTQVLRVLNGNEVATCEALREMATEAVMWQVCCVCVCCVCVVCVCAVINPKPETRNGHGSCHAVGMSCTVNKHVHSVCSNTHVYMQMHTYICARAYTLKHVILHTHEEFHLAYAWIHIRKGAYTWIRKGTHMKNVTHEECHLAYTHTQRYKHTHVHT